jgi:1,4-alpha-glucan branching enzyme
MNDETINGFWIPVLHAHLPFVKHPEIDETLEERWLFEAISESYIPLMMQFKRLGEEGADFSLTISLSPPLLELLADGLLMLKYHDYLERTIELADREKARCGNRGRFRGGADFYSGRYRLVRDFICNELGGDVIEGFRRLANSGNVEIITSCATHAFLPLLMNSPAAVKAQVSVAMESFRKYFGKRPHGIWLPECGYTPGLEDVLKEYGIDYFFVDTHGLTAGTPEPAFGVYAPVFTENGVAVFGRDPDSSRQVWSAEEGYPGDPYYRDFYRDIGYDLDIDYIRPYILPGGIRTFTGLKYYRVTGKGDEKLPYDRARAVAAAKRHAGHFCGERLRAAERLNHGMGRRPVIVSPYDAELFGHWWFEGPEFLYHTFKTLHNSGRVRTVTASEYLDRSETLQIVSPAASSWGGGGYFDTWINRDNDWIYRPVHKMTSRIIELAGVHHCNDDHVRERILNQLARETLLIQSSDWAFLISAETAREYAERRIEEHISNFRTLEGFLDSDAVDMKFLQRLEDKNSIFREMDFRVFAERDHRDDDL